MKTITVNVDVKVRYARTPFIPGRTSGPPESCYPEEGGELEFDIDYDALEADVETAILEDEKDGENKNND